MADRVPRTVVKMYRIWKKKCENLLNYPKNLIPLHFSIILLALVKIIQYNLTIPFGAGEKCITLKG